MHAARYVRPLAALPVLTRCSSGQYLQTGTEVVRLENIDLMKIRFIIGEQNFSRVSVDMPVDIKVSAYPERSFEGSINAIEPAVDYKSGVVQLQAVIPNSDQLLRAGMYAEVDIRQPTLLQQVVIPQSAINFALYGETVYLLDRAAGRR